MYKKGGYFSVPDILVALISIPCNESGNKLPVPGNVIKYGKWRISRLRSVTAYYGNENPSEMGWDKCSL